MNITQTIQTALGENVTRSYPQYVETAATALAKREDEIKDALREYAEGRGLSSNEVDSLFVRVGLTEETLEAPATESPLAELARTLTEQVADLARRISNL